jgi:uncharacterized SAM-binding protein YcdF (DUF218 family)
LRIVLRAAAALGLLTLVLVLVGARLFLWPASHAPAHADAVVVLSGDHGDRLRLALRLLDKGVTRTLVMVGERDSDQARQLCAQGDPDFETVCLTPDPDSTRYEARAVAALMRDRDWHSLVVATTTHHLTRTRLLFRRCSDRKLSFVGSKPAYDRSTSVQVVTHEILGFIYAQTAERGC